MGTVAERRKGNLPAEVNRLIGRRAESTEVRRLLSAGRLVTLTGTGGVGKTRLALDVGRKVSAAFPGGVWLVSLAELTQPDLLPITVLTSLTHARAGAGLAELIDHIGDRQLLLILDNCEHLIDACAKVAIELLQSCPNVRLLATSRESLRSPGETLFPVPPLSLPEPGRQLSAGELERYEAVALFLERASALRPGLSLAPDDEQAVVALCHQLDGLPLAIELAAARTRVLSVQALLARHEDRFFLLTSGPRTAPTRQQTLGATVEYSYELCSPQARMLWARLSVFTGGGEFEAIMAVCADEQLPTDGVQAALAELVDKSIVSFDGDRYRMLETIRQYGIERLREVAREGAMRQAHCEHVAGLAGEVAAGWFGPDQPALLAHALAEQANIRAALDFCLTEPGQAATGLDMAGSLWSYWIGCGLQREGRRWLGRLLAADTARRPERVTALWVNGYLAVVDGDIPVGLALLEECLEVAGALGDEAGVAHATYVRGLAELFAGQIDEAIEDLGDGVRRERALPGFNPQLVTAMVNFGIALCSGEQLPRATAVLEEARTLCVEHNEQWLHSWALVFLGLVALVNDEVHQAKALCQDSLARKRALDDLLGIGIAVEFLAWIALTTDDAECAARLFGAAERLSDPLGAHLAGFQRLLEWHHQYARQARDTLGERTFDQLFSEGHNLTVEEAIACALGETRAAGPTATSTEHLPLTPRERQIAQLVATGKTNREMAGELVIAIRTVDTHVENILGKLGFTSRTQIAALFAGIDG